MSERDGWIFQFSVEEVRDAASRQANYHADRLAYWKEVQEKTKEQIEEEGVEVKPQEVTGGRRYDVIANPSLVKRLNEAEDKISLHQRSLRDFRQWTAVLDTRPAADMVDLDMDDILFFQIKVLEEEE